MASHQPTGFLDNSLFYLAFLKNLAKDLGPVSRMGGFERIVIVEIRTFDLGSFVRPINIMTQGRNV